MVNETKVRIPYRFRNASLDDFHWQQAYEARAFIERLETVNATEKVHREHIPGSGFSGRTRKEDVCDLREVAGLVIVGPVGSGKTHLAAAVARELPPWIQAEFRSALEIIDETKESMRRDRDAPDWGRFEGVLILDDLSGVRGTDFELDTLSRIIRLRNDACLPTVVTTHSGQEALAEMYGTAIASRLLELGPLVKLQGRDRRRDTLEASAGAPPTRGVANRS